MDDHTCIGTMECDIQFTDVEHLMSFERVASLQSDHKLYPITHRSSS